MRAREKGLVLLAVLLAAVFLRLGWWQLSRLEEKRVGNAALAARLSAEPVDVSVLSRDPSVAANRRVRITGEPDYDREIVATFRSRNGSPGVNIFTPVRIAGRDTAVLINRGWVYAGDGSTVDLSRWREPALNAAEGYVRPFSTEAGQAVRNGRVRAVTHSAIAAALPYPIAPYYVVLTSPGADTARTPPPPRIGQPSMSEGSHRSYAIQWFAFAAIALAGTFAFIRLGPGRTDAGRNV